MTRRDSKCRDLHNQLKRLQNNLQEITAQFELYNFNSESNLYRNDLVNDTVSSDRVDSIGPTYESELNNNIKFKKTFPPAQGIVALHTGLTDESRGRTVIYSNELGDRLGPMLGNCVDHRVLNICIPGASYSDIINKILSESICKSHCGSIGSRGSIGVRSSKNLNGLLRQRETILVGFPNHQVASFFSRENSSHGGSSIVIRNNLIFKEITDIVGLFADIEGLSSDIVDLSGCGDGVWNSSGFL
ncbi:hypothetical protein EVAR_30458_1 [Eumeta japonica]|uniref:Uncharacterized protein n=1 Tax=Eumeta variegata TaxID=151549 RepID=A0A4C1VXF5_EUMVA|nr:hypothetical protein EVAR_30458_1 [Eumeta japonica]